MFNGKGKESYRISRLHTMVTVPMRVSKLHREQGPDRDYASGDHTV